MERYLLKNTEETKNSWSHDMSMFLSGMEHARKEKKLKNSNSFTNEQLDKYENRYDEIISEGREQNKKTKGRIAKKEEKTLLNRLEKYKTNHILFIHDFEVPFSNNMSKKTFVFAKIVKKW